MNVAEFCLLKNKALLSILKLVSYSNPYALIKSSKTIDLFYIHICLHYKHGTKLIVVVFPILLQLPTAALALHCIISIGKVWMNRGIIGPSHVRLFIFSLSLASPYQKGSC